MLVSLVEIYNTLYKPVLEEILAQSVSMTEQGLPDELVIILGTMANEGVDHSGSNRKLHAIKYLRAIDHMLLYPRSLTQCKDIVESCMVTVDRINEAETTCRKQADALYAVLTDANHADLPEGIKSWHDVQSPIMSDKDGGMASCFNSPDEDQ